MCPLSASPPEIFSYHCAAINLDKFLSKLDLFELLASFHEHYLISFSTNFLGSFLLLHEDLFDN